MSFVPMLMKELKELVRSYKIIFVPVVFGLLGLMAPVTMKMLPDLMKNASNLPKGTVISIPVPPPGEVVASAFKQFNQMGILLIVLVVMGTIAGERASGVAATVLTKPVGRGGYLAAKALAYSVLVTVSLALGIGIAGYYTQVLIGPVDWGAIVQASLLFLPYLILAVSLTLCYSAFLPSAVAAGGAGVVSVIALNTIPPYLGSFVASVYPGALSDGASALLTGGTPAMIRPLLGTGALILAALLGGWFALERQEI